MPTTMKPTQARKLFRAGASARAVMLDAKIRQQDLATATELPQSRVAEILTGRRCESPRGREMARAIYQALAGQLAIVVNDIPEAREFFEDE